MLMLIITCTLIDKSKKYTLMKHLLIIGARGWGREVYAGAIGTKAYRDREYDVKGFLDSKADAFERLKGNYPPIICALEDYEIKPDDVFFVAMGEPKWHKHYAEMMQVKGGGDSVQYLQSGICILMYHALSKEDVESVVECIKI